MRFNGFIMAAAASAVLAWTGAVAQTAPAGAPALPAQDASSLDASPPRGDTAADAVLDDVKAAFEKRFHGIGVDEVRATPMAGLYEVRIGMELVYVDADVDHVLQGSLLDARTRTDLTAQRVQKLSEVPFDSLPLALAVKQVKGDGSRQMAVFEDPNCIYCKQLHANLKDVDNVTVYSFLYPILSPDSITKARDIWCAPDSAAAWSAWMLDGEKPAAAQCDDDPVDDVMALGRKLMVQGTPAILFSDGSRVSGALSTEELERKLATP